MAAGDLIDGDDQYEVNGHLIGDSVVHLGEEGVSGWDDEAVNADDAELSVGGSASGYDVPAARDIRVPVLIVAADEAAARSELALLRAAWRAGGQSTVELHRQVAGQREYLRGRTRGCVVEMGMVRDGMIPVLCTFFAGDPVVHAVGGS